MIFLLYEAGFVNKGIIGNGNISLSGAGSQNSNTTSNRGVINAPGPQKAFVSLKDHRPDHLRDYSIHQAFLYLKRITDPSIVPRINESHEIHDWTTLYDHVVKFLSLIGLSTTNFSITGLQLTYTTYNPHGSNRSIILYYAWKVFIYYTGEKWDIMSITFESLTGTIINFEIGSGPSNTDIYDVIEKNKWIVVNKTGFYSFVRVPVITRENYTSYINYMLYILSLGRPQLYGKIKIVYSRELPGIIVFQTYVNDKSVLVMSGVYPGASLAAVSVWYQREKGARMLHRIVSPIGLLIHYKYINRKPLITSSEAVEAAKRFLMDKFNVPLGSIIVNRVCETFFLVKPWIMANFWCVILTVYGVEVYHVTIYVDPVKGVVYDYSI